MRKSYVFLIVFLQVLLTPTNAYSVTANRVWRIPPGGTVGAWGPVNLSDGTNAVTGSLASKANLPAAGISQTAGGGNFNTTSATYVDVTGLTITKTTLGRPVLVFMQGNDENSNTVTMNNISASVVAGSVRFVRDGSSNSTQLIAVNVGDVGEVGVNYPCSAFIWWDTGASAGSHTWKVMVQVGGGSQFTVAGCSLVVYEL